jgi:hypothetical protein
VTQITSAFDKVQLQALRTTIRYTLKVKQSRYRPRVAQRVPGS